MNCALLGSVFFVLACSPRGDDRPPTSPTTVPVSAPAPAPSAVTRDGGTIVTPPPETDHPVDVPHGAISRDPTLFAQEPARRDAGRDAR